MVVADRHHHVAQAIGGRHHHAARTMASDFLIRSACCACAGAGRPRAARRRGTAWATPRRSVRSRVGGGLPCPGHRRGLRGRGGRGACSAGRCTRLPGWARPPGRRRRGGRAPSTRICTLAPRWIDWLTTKFLRTLASCAGAIVQLPRASARAVIQRPAACRRNTMRRPASPPARRWPRRPETMWVDSSTSSRSSASSVSRCSAAAPPGRAPPWARPPPAQLRIVEQRLRDARALAHAAGVAGQGPVGRVLQADLGQALVDARLGGRQSLDRGQEREELACRQRQVDAEILRQVAQRRAQRASGSRAMSRPCHRMRRCAGAPASPACASASTCRRRWAPAGRQCRDWRQVQRLVHGGAAA